MTELKGTKWAFTSWERPIINEIYIDYIVWCLEETPTTGRLHYQGYVEFKKEYTMRYIKSLFKCKEMHLELARSNREANRNYCLKTKDYEIMRQYDTCEIRNDKPQPCKFREPCLIEQIFFNSSDS